MKKFYIRYHIVGNRVVTDVREFDSFGEAIAKVSKGLNNKVIAVLRNGEHVIEIKTEHITYHEVIGEKEYKKERDLNQLSNLAGMALR